MTDNFSNNPYGEEPKYSSAEYQPPPGPESNAQFQSSQYGEYNMPKKKRKTWLWVTLGITIPLFFCGLGIGGCSYLLFDSTRVDFDVTNNFYAALRDDSDINPYICDELRSSPSFNSLLIKYEDNYGPVESFDFNSFETVNGTTEIMGIVNRTNRRSLQTSVRVIEEDGTERVCNIVEVSQSRGLAQ